MDKKILIICPYPHGIAAGQRLKYEQYFNNWKDNNYNITISSFFDYSAWNILHKKNLFFLKFFYFIKGLIQRLITLFFIRNYDIVYVFMWVTPIGSSLIEKLYLKLSKKIIYDFDDSIHIVDNFSNNLSINKITNFFKNKKKYIKLIQYSNHIIVSSPFHVPYCTLKNIYNKCTYIPCSLDVDYFKSNNKNNYDFNSNDTIKIGWTGTFTSKIYLESVSNVLIRLNDLINFELIIISNFTYSLPNIKIRNIKWNKENEISDLELIDIGIYPLLKNKWSLGKGALKAMQYMALNIPTVATNYGTTSKVIDNYKDGILVNNDDEWIDAILYLINHPIERKLISKNARNKIIDQYSTKALENKYINILNSQ